MTGTSIWRVVKRALWYSGLTIYFGGCVVLNWAVKEACTHGNCIHGWYSQYNTAEKLFFFAWAIGLPAAAIGLHSMVSKKSAPVQQTPRKARPPGRRSIDVPYATAKARKDWTCHRCRSRISAGATYWYTTVGYGRETSRFRYCRQCSDALSKEANAQY